MRADQLLVERGLAVSRSQATRLVAAGVRWRVAGADWRRVGKSGEAIPAHADLEVLDAAEARFVSRGGLKLEGALGASGIEASGRRCLDVGQSTGGFTDCLLQHGAAEVVGIDVGHGQLHARLRADARVRAVEKVNARALCAPDLRAAGDSGEPFELIVGDLSFISLTLVLPALALLLAPQGELLMLVKPQFELQPGQIGKGGIVRDPALYADVESRLRAACEALSLRVAGWHDSPIAGGDGNREFFIHAARQDGR
ncbi:TlyA family RNA methyltransferase [Variovorax dokdonensis]|uniref:TlyA family RNA methyltransferase n=1 Tax=Variovorax dokdonensis TaxID=344883 RepID=A0ABT7N4Z0_9BURK|nr:TlyA family RNA methyltransferase [Variovorax dokdonensis]MDM0043006.1 TlyA family RNA methyltransferase [Variovorax dokdonensis]